MGNPGIGEPHRTPGSHTGKPVRTKGDAGPREATKGSHGAHQGRPRAAGKSQMEATKGRSAPRTAPGHREATKGSYKGKPRGTKDAPGRRETTKGSHTRKPRDTKDAPGHRGTTKRSHGAPRTPRATGKQEKGSHGAGESTKGRQNRKPRGIKDAPGHRKATKGSHGAPTQSGSGHHHQPSNKAKTSIGKACLGKTKRI